MDCQYYYQLGYDDGYKRGYSAGYASGYKSGSSEGYDKGHQEGYNAGYRAGYEAGYSEGYETLHTRVLAGLRDALNPEKVAECGVSPEKASALVSSIVNIIREVLDYDSTALQVLPVLAEKGFHGPHVAKAVLHAASILGVLREVGERYIATGPQPGGEKVVREQLLPFAWEEIIENVVMETENENCTPLSFENARKAAKESIRLILDNIALLGLLGPDHVRGDPRRAAEDFVATMRAKAVQEYYSLIEKLGTRLASASRDACERHAEVYRAAMRALASLEESLRDVPDEYKELIRLETQLEPRARTVLVSTGRVEVKGWVEGVVIIRKLVDPGNPLLRVFSRRRRELHKRLTLAEEWARRHVEEAARSVEEASGAGVEVEVRVV